MDMPEVYRCFGIFPPKYASYLISLFGLGCGGVGLAGIILFGLVEDSIVSHLIKSQQVDGSVKKGILMAIGLTSLVMFVANAFLFLGGTFSSRGCVAVAVWMIMIMCFIIIAAAIGAPVSCFFLPSTCFIKKLSSGAMVLGYFAVTIFLFLWLYFMVVAYNLQNEM